MTAYTVSSGTTTSGITLSAGDTLVVSSGGTATAITVGSGATETVNAGGTDSGTTISLGGFETVSGTALGDAVYGSQFVASLGTVASASNETVYSGGAITYAGTGDVGNNITIMSGGSITATKAASLSNITLVSGGSITLASAKGNVAGSVNFTGSGGTITYGTAPSSAAFAAVISGFTSGDVFDYATVSTGGIVSESVNSAGNLAVTISGSGYSTSSTITVSQTLQFAGLTSGQIGQTTDANGDVELVFVCFATGTQIRTVSGDVAVEDLAIGDMVVTASGAVRPILWIGSRATSCIGHPTPRKVWPYRVRAGALGNNLPDRDLWLSPGHALCVDDVLIPVRHLAHEDRIAQVELDEVVYWHIELATHDIILANGLPTESYLDTGNRCGFDNSDGAVELYPDFEPLSTDGFCRPYVQSGPVLAEVRARLFGKSRTDAGGELPIYLLVDGEIVTGTISGGNARFLIPADVGDIRIVTPSARSYGSDIRTLGVPIAKITIVDGVQVKTIDLSNDGLFAGFHDIEANADGSWRWTDRQAHLSSALWSHVDGAFMLSLTGLFDILPHRAEGDRLAA